jgi:hypothetical protein
MSGVALGEFRGAGGAVRAMTADSQQVKPLRVIAFKLHFRDAKDCRHGSNPLANVLWHSQEGPQLVAGHAQIVKVAIIKGVNFCCLGVVMQHGT